MEFILKTSFHSDDIRLKITYRYIFPKALHYLVYDIIVIFFEKGLIEISMKQKSLCE